jgi:hypothetical protein
VVPHAGVALERPDVRRRQRDGACITVALDAQQIAGQRGVGARHPRARDRHVGGDADAGAVER